MIRQIAYVHGQRQQLNISLRKHDEDTKGGHTLLNPIPKYTQKIPHNIFLFGVYSQHSKERKSKKQITLLNGWKWRSKLTLAWCRRSSNASSIYRAFLCKFSMEALNAFSVFSFHSCNNRSFLTLFIIFSIESIS